MVWQQRPKNYQRWHLTGPFTWNNVGEMTNSNTNNSFLASNWRFKAQHVNEQYFFLEYLNPDTKKWMQIYAFTPDDSIL
jgi:hypothetical protein